MQDAVPAAPPRGTRPANRRALIVAAAWDLFVSRGYADVSMGDIATAVNIGASALYRHFSSKAELLAAVVHSGIEPFAEVARARPSDLRQLITSMATTAGDHGRVGVLWQREARNLDATEQAKVRTAFREVTHALADAIVAERPAVSAADADFLAWCVMAALVATRYGLSRDAYVEVLVELCETIAGLELEPAVGPAASTVRSDPEADRREQIIVSASELFAERGYGAVGIDEIAESVGIAGPSIYGHFESKQAILVAAIERGTDILDRDAAEVLASGVSGQEALAALIRSYVSMATGNRFLIRMLLSEMDQLPPAERATARARQVSYIDVWVALLREYTELDATTARVRVQAALLVVNDTVQTRHLRARQGFETALAQVAASLLCL